MPETRAAQNSKSTNSSKRSFLRFLIFPRKQLKYAFFHFLLIALSVMIVNLVSYYKFLALVQSTSNEQTTTALSEYTLTIAIVTLLTLVTMGVITFFVEIVFLHRFVGPILPLIKHLDAILQGNTSFRTRLRDGDEIQEIAEKLNEVSEMLEIKKSS